MAEQQRILGGRYLLKDKVGTGGMATVYRAQDQVLDRTVAVKIMLPQYAGDPTFAARFKQEAQAAAGLQSPYIVGVYDWGKDGDTYYIVMEYLRGTDLKSGIRSHGALDPKKVAQIGSQICGALSVAHKHEIIHRDIKPQNIMVLPDGNIKVMDFGIARAKNSHLTQDNNVLGTAHYVSPEQARGQELGPTSDIYSLGVVMYECATGKVPFDGDDAISVAVKQMNELPVPPSQVNPRVDADLERIILKCMEKDPANRFQTADELRQVLNNYLAGRAVDVAEPTRLIPGAMPAGTTETRVMGNATQAMVRPANGVGSTVSRGGVAAEHGKHGFEEEEEHRGGKGKIAAIIIAVIAVIALAVFAVSSFMGTDNEPVTVPNVLNLEQDQAVQDIRDAGLEPKVESDYSSTVAEGLVIKQSPEGNKQAKKGSTVTITVSKGEEPAEQVTMTKIVGMTAEEAEAELARLGLTGKAISEPNDAAEGTVFSQSVNAGTKVDKGTEVEYHVSTGPETVNVPGVVGMTEAKATNTLSAAGFQVKTADGGFSDTYAEGTVMKQDPTGQVKPGAEVTIYLSQGKEQEPEPEKPQETTTPSQNEETQAPSGQQQTSGTVSVPSLSGMTKAQAEAALQKAGLVGSFSYADGTQKGVDPDHVMSWSPNGSVKKGGTVNVVVAYSDPTQ